MNLKGFASVIVLVCAASAAQGQMQWVKLDSIGLFTEPAAGYWRVVPSGAIFRCEPRAGHSGEYSFTLMYSPDLSLPPGTFFGTMTPSGKQKIFDANLMHNPAKKHSRESRRSFTIEMDENADRMTFKPYHDRLSVNLNRLLPYFFRITLKRENTRPDNIDGAVRIDGTETFGGNIVIL